MISPKILRSPDMLLVTYEIDATPHFAFLVGEWLYNCHEVHPALPTDASTFIAHWERWQALAVLMDKALRSCKIKAELKPTPVTRAQNLEAIIYPGLFNKKGDIPATP